MASLWARLRDSVKATTTSIKEEINEAKATPTQILCMDCNTLLPIPSSTFDWKCETGHVNQDSSSKCSAPSCQGLKPKNRTEPLIRCTKCNTMTPIPFTNAEKQLREAGRNIKTQVEHMKSKPSTFNCTNCDNLLMAPTGSWVCQTCTTVNAEGLEKCSSCLQKYTDQKVICGVCKRSTQVPSMNIVNTLTKGFRDASKGTMKVYYDLTKSPYVTCPRCYKNIAVDLKAHQPPSTDTKEKKEVEVTMDEETESCIRSLQCTSCGMTLNYMPPSNIPPTTVPAASQSTPPRPVEGGSTSKST